MNNAAEKNFILDLNSLEQTMNAYVRETLGVSSIYLPSDVEKLSDQSMIQLGSERGEDKPNHNFDLFIDKNDLFSVDLLNNKNNKVKYLVMHLRQNKSVFENETRDVFAKMVQALKLSPQHLLVLEAQAAIGATTKKITADHLQEWLVNVLKTPMKILILSEGESQLSGQIKGRHQFFVTHSPYDFVLQSNDLKKVAWSVMQNFVL